MVVEPHVSEFAHSLSAVTASVAGAARSNRLRADIQALRAIAVSQVVVFHAEPRLMQSGQLGVDIFFVISGYLITGLIARGVDAGTFRLRDFWLRRARRILPAALTTVLLTGALGFLILDGTMLASLGAQVLSATGFVANFYFAQQPGGYFARSAEFQPLLHFWSLAVEEQYYLLAPILLAWTPKRYRLSFVASVTLASLALFVRPHLGLTAVSAFYFPVTRGWELGLGGLAALLPTLHHRTGRIGSWLSWLLLLVVLATPAMPLVEPWNARAVPQAVAVCLATALFLNLDDAKVQAAAGIRALWELGSLSYGLYLVHWPVLSLFRSARLEQHPSAGQTAAALIAAVLLAIALHRWLEDPIHHGRLRTAALLKWIVVGVIAAVALGMVALRVGAIERQRPSAVQGNFLGLGSACSFYGGSFDLAAPCRNVGRPEMLVWGDSIGMSLVPGLIASGAGVQQATKALCGPLLDDRPKGTGVFDDRWAEGCLAFNRSVFRQLQELPSVRIVVLVSAFDQYLYRDGGRSFFSDGEANPERVRAALASLRRTVAAIRATGRRVIVVQALPRAGFDVGLCNERRAAGRLVLGHRGCMVDTEDRQSNESNVRHFMAAAGPAADVGVISFYPTLCRDRWCRTTLDGVSLYYDAGHFSPAGARLLVARMGLVRRIRAESR